MDDIRRRFAERAIVPVVASLAAATSVGGHASETAAAPTTLRGVMQEMGRDMQEVAGAISMEDWTEVAALALSVSRHAEPPASEKMRILGWLRTDASNFRTFDQQVRAAANAMGEAATRGDGEAVINAFADLQQSCLDCHQRFRKAFVEHFHERR